MDGQSPLPPPIQNKMILIPLPLQFCTTLIFCYLLLMRTFIGFGVGPIRVVAPLTPRSPSPSPSPSAPLPPAGYADALTRHPRETAAEYHAARDDFHSHHPHHLVTSLFDPPLPATLIAAALTPFYYALALLYTLGAAALVAVAAILQALVPPHPPTRARYPHALRAATVATTFFSLRAQLPPDPRTLPTPLTPQQLRDSRRRDTTLFRRRSALLGLFLYAAVYFLIAHTSLLDLLRSTTDYLWR